MRKALQSRGIIPFALVFAVCGMLVAAENPSDTPAPDTAVNEELSQYDAVIAASDREHWSFLPIERPEIPEVKNRDWIFTPIDNFILANLESIDWKPAATVERRVWLRRVWLDVIGIPPSPAEQERFANDASPTAYANVVDELLTRPGYGERWGRHWLDLVRFAETNGYERDAIKPKVWRFRDYVISAFNKDKPYNQFVLEQLAGDELEDTNTESVIATGYYRLAPWDDEPADFPQDRADQLDDMVRTTSRVFLGLTLGCSRCHNHKFDALTMHDYYRMVAVFDPLKRPQRGRTEIARQACSQQEYAAIIERDGKITATNKKIVDIRNSIRAEFLLSEKSKLPDEVIAAFRVDDAKRNAAQKKLITEHSKALDAELTDALPRESQTQIAKLNQTNARLRIETPDFPQAYFMYEPSPKSPTTHLLLRGRASLPGPVVQPGVPAVLVSKQPTFLPSDQFTTRRRLTLARWITSPENPLTARVIVNRVWQYHFGEGLVTTSSEYGILGMTPTHPELLDWLADWFTHEGEWSFKKLHRLILTSNTYRMSKRWNTEYGIEDPENMNFWRFPYRRLEVEAIRDSMLSVTDKLNRKMYGPSTYLSVPKEALDGSSDPGKIWKPFVEREASRRTIYAFVKRSMVVPMLEVLDLCDTTRSVEKRETTSVPTQALTLYNGEFVNRQSRHFANRLVRDAGDDRSRQIERAYLLALCRPPRPEETAAMQQFLIKETKAQKADAEAARQPVSAEKARHGALVAMCRVILNLNEFVYAD